MEIIEMLRNMHVMMIMKPDMTGIWPFYIDTMSEYDYIVADTESEWNLRSGKEALCQRVHRN